MATIPELEQRLSAVERALAELQQRIGGPIKEHWIKNVIGSFADDPVFDKILEYGREARRADRPSDET